MQIKQKKITKRTTLLSISVVTLIICGSIVALERFGVTNFFSNRSEFNGPSEIEKKQQEKAEKDQKKDFIENTPNSSDTTDSQTEASIELSAKQESNNTITILTKLFNVPSGTCTLSIVNGSKNHSEVAEIIYQPSFSSCAGFSVAKEKLGAGQWSITLTLSGVEQQEKNINFVVN